ncbi:VIT family protein [uncultured archaeon]|nr:VIT family protein [uncultured archaeon]
MEKHPSIEHLQQHLDEIGKQNTRGDRIRQIILGGQDGLVNVMGIVLGVATATADNHLVILAGLSATFAESISMAAVAFTSSRAAKAHYLSEFERERQEIRGNPEVERKEVELVYAKKGFSGETLERIVAQITSDEEKWLNFMMTEELQLQESSNLNPTGEAIVVGISAFIGSLISLWPFFLGLPASTAILWSLVCALAVLFAAGALTAKLTIGGWVNKGVEMAAIGGLAAGAGYAVGRLIGA